MGDKEALRFLARLDHDLELQGRLRAVPAGDLDAVVRVAAEAGFDFDVAGLRAAFRTDWRMRRRHFSDRPPDTP
jgi:hypothetical protein